MRSASALAVLTVFVVGACDSADEPMTEKGSGSAAYETPRLSAEIPEGWETTEEPLSGLIDPEPVLSAASFDLSGSRSHANCTPVRALERMPRDGALVIVLAYGKLSARGLRQLPPRPERFRLAPADYGEFECSGPSYNFDHREHGYGYKINVWLDPDVVDPEIRRQAVQLLNSLELRAGP